MLNSSQSSWQRKKGILSTEIILTNQNVNEFMSAAKEAAPDLEMSRCRCMIAHVRLRRGENHVTLVEGDRLTVEAGAITIRLKDTPASAVVVL